MPETDIGAAVARLIEKMGDSTKAVEKLYEENFQLRGDKRDLKKDLDAAQKENEALKAQVADGGVPKGKKLVDEGAVVLSKEDAGAFEKYKEFGSTEEVETALKAKKDLEVKVAEQAKKAEISEIADHMGWNTSVLARLGSDLEYKVESGEKGKAVLVKGEGDKYVALKEYAEKNWQDFLPSLNLATDRKQVLTQAPAGVPSSRKVSDEDIKADQDKRMEIAI